MKTLSLFSFVILITLGCTDTGTLPESGKFGTFKLNMQDTLGVSFSTGSLTLIDTDSIIVGSWSLSDGRSGKLIGTISNSHLEVNLNPEFIDANLILVGTLSAKIYSGQWFQIGFGGVMAQGLFIAEKP
jgi:hypothetical protein